MNKIKKHITIVILVVMALVLVYLLFFNLSGVLDFAVCTGFFTLLFYFDRKKNFTTGVFLLLCAAILIHLFGAAGLYSKFVFGIIGYDKVVHFVSGLALSLALLQISSEKWVFWKYATVILAVAGLGAIAEINEFVGTAYFGLETGGIFAIGDGLPSIKSDLQVYDTYFDMLFNLAGTLVAVLLNLSSKKRFIFV